MRNLVPLQSGLFFSEVFELCDTKSDETKVERPFRLKEFFVSFIKPDLRFDPPIESFPLAKRFVRTELVFQRDSPACLSSSSCCLEIVSSRWPWIFWLGIRE